MSEEELFGTWSWFDKEAESYGLTKGGKKLLRLVILIDEMLRGENQSFKDLPANHAAKFQSDKDWLKVALGKMMDEGVKPLKALELQVGQGRKPDAAPNKKNMELVWQVEELRNQGYSQEEAIAEIAQRLGRTEEATRGRYKRTLLRYREKQRRQDFFKQILQLRTLNLKK